MRPWSNRRAIWIAQTALLVPLLSVEAAADASAVRSRVQEAKGQLVELKAQLSDVERKLRTALETSTVHCITGKFDQSIAKQQGCRGVEEKVSEGQILLELQDYERASILLFDAVETQGFERSAVYNDAVFALAEALYNSGNLVGARTYYGLLVERGAQMYAQNAIKRLIEISGRLNDYTNVDEYFDAYLKISGGSVRPEIAYVRGKYLLRAGRPLEAAKLFDMVPQSNSYGLKAIYLKAVSVLAQGGPDATKQAVEIFHNCSNAKPRNKEETEVQELAHLAQGRLYYELGELVKSADAYQDIPRTSPYFADMLFEVTWTFIKRGQLQEDPNKARLEFQKALQALDILLIAAPESRLGPDIKILRGNLYLRLGDFDKASTAFDDVISDYRPTMDKLEALMSERGDTRRLLEDILAADERDLTVDSLLPPLAAKWAHSQEEIDDALRVYRELRVGKTEVEAARQVISKLQRVLDAQNRVELFPSVSEVHAQSLTIRDRVLRMRSETADLQRDLLKGSSVVGYLDAVKKRKALEAKFNAIPRTTEGFNNRVNRISGNMEELERSLFKLSLAIDTQLAMLAAINKHLVDMKASGKMDPADEEYWVVNVTQVRASIDQLQQEHDSLAALIKEEQEGLSISGGADGQEEEIRVELQKALAKEADLITQARSKASSEELQLLGEIDTVTVEIEHVLKRANEFAKTMEEEVGKRAEMIARAVAVEQGRLDKYERDVLRYENEAGDVAANAAVLALRSVRDEFYDFVLRADVGLVDMAWQYKKEKSDEISRLVRRQRTELRSLDQEFGEVLQAEE